MVVLDVTVMNIALPSAQQALGFTTVDRQWVVTAYTLWWPQTSTQTTVRDTVFPAPATVSVRRAAGMSAGWRYVLVELEDVARVVAALEADQPVPGLLAVGFPDTAGTLVVEMVHVTAASRPGAQSLP